MRIATIAILSLTLFVSAQADAAVFSLPGVELAHELNIAGMQRLLGWNGGNAYVAKKDGSVGAVDKDGHELQVFQFKDSKGIPLLKRPWAVAVANNTVYVADSEANLVAMFTTQGKFLGSFGAKNGGFFSSNENALASPHGIAIHEGIVYVSDSGNGRVQLYGINGVFLSTLEIDSAPENVAAKEKKLPYKLGKPSDIAVDALGRIYVLDADDGMVKVYSPEGAYLKHLPDGAKALSFSMARDGIYVADRDSYTISKYDFKDGLLYTFGSMGKGRGQFGNMAGLATDKDMHVFVGDSEKGIADVFKVESGAPFEPVVRQPSRTSVRLEQTVPLPVGKMAWDGKEAIYGIVTDDKDSSKKIVRIVNGTVTGEIRIKDISPEAVAVDRSGTVWVLDKKKAILAKLDETGKILLSIGSPGSGRGEFDDPEDFAISSTGTVFVADSGNHRLQAFSSDGIFLKEIRSDTAGKLQNPVAISFDSLDALYVLDKDRAIVSHYSSLGEPLDVFGNRGESKILSKPVSLMVTPDEVFVLDSNQVRVFSLKGQYIRSFGTNGSGMGELDEPVDIVATGESMFSISERGNKRLQSFVTLHKPLAPEHLVVLGDVHAIKLHWTASALPYVKQYRIFRAEGEDLAFVQVATSSTDKYVDQNVEVGKKYLYQVKGETQYGYVGPKSNIASGAAEKYVPPPLQSVKAEPSQFQIKMSWKPADPQYFSAYLVYQKDEETFTKIGETVTPEFVKKGLVPNTEYTYFISTLGTDGVESERFAITVSTLAPTGAPLEINVVKLRDVFSTTYKLYEQEGIGRITLTNNTDKPLERIKVSFMLNNFMDFPTETQVEQILPGQSEEVTLKAIFNNNILSISEDSSIQTSIEASYLQDGVPVVYTKNPTISIYERHRMTWDEDQRLASFITPKDTPIINFARSVATQFHDARDEAQQAAVLFDAMGVMGFTYIQNPVDPYQVSIRKTPGASDKTDTVDYVQYPRETLERKSGDCVDLVSFYATALEGMGINTLMLEVPDHLLMMFSTGINADADGYTMNDMFVIHDGKLWIPVETTVVGKPFIKAWELGAANYYKWKDNGLAILDVHTAWNTYKPPTLPISTLKTVDVTAGEIEKKFPGDFLSMLNISSQTKTRRYLMAIEKNPGDTEAYLQIGIILAKMGNHEEAMKYFDRILETEPKNAAALNNRGNLFMLDEKFPEAQKAYLAATQSSPDDPYVWINLAKSYKATKNTKNAKGAFVKAQHLDPTVKQKYKTLALELLNAL